MFVVFGAGAVLIAFACFESRWQAHLCGNSATCRRQFLFAGGLALLVVAGLVLFATVA
jgi:hypothetical protein